MGRRIQTISAGVVRSAPAAIVRTGSACFIAAVSLMLPTTSSPLMADEKASSRHGVRIEGGPDVSGQNYFWTVTPPDDTYLDRLVFPHYGANTFDVPDDWDWDCTKLIQVGTVAGPGECVATNKSVLGSPNGEELTFRMGLGPAGASRGTGTVIVSLGNGSIVTVPDVALPTDEPTSERYITLVALAAMFGLLILVQAVRKRKSRRSGART